MSKKKRNKKYRPANSTTDKPIIHTFVAEKEEKLSRHKTFKRRLVLWGAISLVLAAIFWWLV